MRRLLTSLLLLALPAAAQNDSEDRLKDLEVQRELDRQYRACVARQDLPGAARALVRASKLTFVIPPPFSTPKDAAVHLRLMARDLRLRSEGARWKGLQARQKIEVPQELLESLDRAVREAYSGDDLGQVTARMPAASYAASYNWGRRLRAMLPYFPCAPGRLSPKLRKSVKEEWRAASMTARRDFLRNALLEARAFAARAAFLDVKDKPGLAAGAKQARRVDPEFLQLSPEEHAGSWVTTTLTLAKPARGTPPYPFLFEGVLSVKELDRRLLVVYFYDQAAQSSLVDAGRMKIAPHLVKWARSYPGRSLEKRISKFKVGARVVVLGRVLVCEDGSPSHVLEIWKAELEK
jgi:hypothetical protein